MKKQSEEEISVKINEALIVSCRMVICRSCFLPTKAPDGSFLWGPIELEESINKHITCSMCGDNLAIRKDSLVVDIDRCLTEECEGFYVIRWVAKRIKEVTKKLSKTEE